MQIVEEERVVEVCKDDDDHHNMMQQIINKGKRTKRQRFPSPLRIAIALPSSCAPGLFDLPTTTTTKVTAMAMASNEFRRTEEEENDVDMANCLILLAQGHYHNNKASKSSHLASPNSKNNKVAASSSGLYNLYECKTCNRCFPSFQALGGHRASHKKPKTNNNNNGIINIAQDHHHHHQKQGGVTTSTTSSFVNGDIDHHHNNNNYVPTTSTTLTLQIPNRGSFNSRNTVSTTPTPKSKVHECSICGAEFASGQALGGHMRRHRAFLSMSSATTTTTTPSSSMSLHESSPQEGKTVVPKNVLKLDLNLPAAPEDDHHRESNNNNKFAFQSKEKVIVFSTANSLVDCQY